MNLIITLTMDNGKAKRLCPHDPSHDYIRQKYGYVRVLPSHQSICFQCWMVYRETHIFHSPHGSTMIMAYLDHPEGNKKFRQWAQDNPEAYEKTLKEIP